jgi:hypothetical protein
MFKLLASELNQARQTLRSWRQLPEFWIIICTSLFFTSLVWLGVALEILVFPHEAELAITHSGQFKFVIMRSVEIPCRLYGLKFYGYKFDARGDSNLATGVVCWDFTKRRWEWAMDDQELQNYNSNPARP